MSDLFDLPFEDDEPPAEEDAPVLSKAEAPGPVDVEGPLPTRRIFTVTELRPAMFASSAAMLPCALVMPLSVGIAFTPSSTLALVLICVVTFAHMAWKTNLMTITNDIYPTGVVGSISGVIAFGSGLGGTLFTNLTGQVVQHFSYTPVWVASTVMYPTGLLLVRLLLGRQSSST